MDLGILSAGLLRNGTVSTGSGRSSGGAKALRNENVSLIRSSEQQPSTPDGLGDDIEDGKEENLFVWVQLASTLAESKSNGVEGPNHDQGERDLVVKTANLGAAKESGGTARGDQLEENPGESDARDGEEAPLAGLGRVNTSNDTGDDHHQVSNDKDDDLGNGKAGEEGKIEEEKRGGQGPVDVCQVQRRQKSIDARGSRKKKVSIIVQTRQQAIRLYLSKSHCPSARSEQSKLDLHRA